MDFFSHQDQARRKTGILVFYFMLAVALIVLAVNGVVYFFIDYFATAQISSIPNETRLDSSIWIYLTLGTLAVILSGSLFRFFALAGGGEAVANMVSAREVDLDTRDLEERKYINVVEEMSIASGVPMPRLYVMDEEEGINAFVAGYQPTQAVMVVTRGTLETLSRDELQGVVAHEYSHILNGDMRINVRLIAVLAGILLIGKIGEVLMRSGRHSRRRNDGMAIGIALFVVGYIGLFFGRLIKAAISRQREFLADASSVQFTRNTDGIAGALYKIQQSINGTLIHNSHAEDMSHMCFGQAVKLHFSGLLATHPPLDVRINAIDPLFLRKHQQQDWSPATGSAQDTEQPVAGFAAGAVAATPSEVADSIGNPTPAHLLYAEQMFQQLDPQLLDTVHQPQGAQAFLFGLVAARTRGGQVDAFLQQHVPGDIVARLQEQSGFIEKMERQLRLPLIDIAIASIKRLPQEKIDGFVDTLEQLIKLDGKFTLLEFVLLTLVKKQLSGRSSYVTRVHYRSFRPLLGDIQLILSVLAQTAQQSAQRTEDALQRNMRAFTTENMPLIPAAQVNIAMINEALGRINRLPAMMKKSFLTSCADLVIDDGIIMPLETELLRAIAETLDCPMPPLLVDSQRR